MNNGYPSRRRELITRLVFSLVLIFLLHRFIAHALLHQLEAPVLQYAYIDPVYVLFSISGFAAAIVEHYWLALLIDCTMVLSALGLVIFPLRRVLAVLFTLSYFIYFVVYNLYGMHHVHSMIGIFLIALPFWTRSNQRFDFQWKALRYYTLLLYVIAFTWKLVRGSWFHPGQSMAILKDNLTTYMYFNPTSFRTELYQYFMMHPSLLQALHILAVAMEGIFLTGFFTRKYDHLLIANGILLHLGILFFVDADFIELFVLYLTMVKWRGDGGG